MADVVLIAGSPAHPARSTVVLALAARLLREEGLETDLLVVRELPAEPLLYADREHPALREAARRVENARAVVIATPIYKAAYSGTLKAFLDTLPQNALAEKLVLPIATGGSLAHLLALDYALKPVLAALGAKHILSGVFLTDAQVALDSDGCFHLEEGGEGRLRSAIGDLARELRIPVRKAY